MGPLDWLKNKVGSGISDIGHAVSDVAGDVESAFGGGNSNGPAPAQPSVAQSGGGNLSVQPVSQSPAISIAKTASPSGPNPIAIQNSNPQPAASQTGIQGGPTPVVSGLTSVSDVNNALNNPNVKIQQGNPNAATPTASQVLTGQHATPVAPAQPNQPQSPNSGPGLTQLATVKGVPLTGVNNQTPQPAPAPQPVSPHTSLLGHIENVGKQVAGFAGDVGKGLASGVSNTVTGDIVEPTRQIVAQATGDQAAANAAGARATADQQASLPYGIVKNVVNLGGAANNLFFKDPIQAAMGNNTASNNSFIAGMHELNQTSVGAVASPFERLVANLGGAVNPGTETSGGIEQQVGLNPAESLTKTLLNAGLNATMVGKPAYGLGEQFAETPLAQGIIDTTTGLPARIGEAAVPLAGNEIGAVGRDINAVAPEPVDENPPQSVGDILANRNVPPEQYAQEAARISPAEGETPTPISPEDQSLFSSQPSPDELQGTPIEPSARSADNTPGVVLRESRPTTPGGFYTSQELLKNPRTGEMELTNVDHVNGQRLPRNANGERAALQALKDGGIRDDAIRAYKEAIPGASDSSARFAVQRAAQEANVALKPNERGENPINFDLPKVNEGDFGKARSNPQVVQSLIENRGIEAIRSVRKLNTDEKVQFWDAVESGGLTRDAKLNAAIQRWRNLADTVHATDVGSGGTTPYIKNYAIHNWDLSDPEDEARFNELAQKQGFTLDPNDYSGYQNRPRIFKTVEEGRQAGFHLQNEDPTDDITKYTNGASMRIGDQALAKSFDQAMGNSSDRNMTFNIRPGTDMKVSQEAMKELHGYEQSGDINAIHNMYRTANRKLKQTILSVSLYHPNNINFFQVFPTLLAEGHPILAFKALGGSYAALVSKGLVTNEVESALNDGTIEAAARMGTPIRWGNDYESAGKIRIGKEGFGERAVFEQSIPYAHIQMVRAVLSDLAKKKVDLDSPEARAAGLTVNKIMGFINKEVENGNPHVQGLVSDVFFAPQFTRAKWGVLKDALNGGVSGSYARRAVLGKYLMQVGITMAASAIDRQSTDSTKDMFIRNLVSPSIPTPIKNSKGTNVELAMPQNFISEGLGLGASLKRNANGHLGLNFSPSQIPSNIAQYGRNRLAVLPSTGLKIATNTSFSNEPLRDKTATPGEQAIQVATNAANSVLPISLQGIAGTKVAQRVLPSSVNQAIKIQNPNNSLVASGLSSLGFTPKPDVTTGYDLTSSNYFNKASQIQHDLSTGNLSAIDPSLKNVSPQEGQYLMNQYNSLHPSNTKDLTTGIAIPKNWNALSDEQKASYYLANDQTTGAQTLSPVFYADKALSKATPGFPVNPLFTLSGNGLGPDGKDVPKAQVALNYSNMPVGDPQRSVLLAANGGDNGWLSKYETAVGNYGNNYTKNMTTYLQQNGWSKQAITNYWQQHPNSNPPVQPPNFSPSTQNLMTQYDAITDPTARSQFYAANSTVLGDAFDQEAQYVNQRRAAEGELALQGYPTESAHVTAILNSMPTGETAADKSARGALINNNPDVNQYLANVSLYDTTKNLSEYNYVNPATPKATEGQELNDGSTMAQKTLEDISNLGDYDIAKNSTTGQYQFMNNGGFGAGYSSGSSSSSSDPFVAAPRAPHKEHGKLRAFKIQHARPVKVKHIKPIKSDNVKIKQAQGFRPLSGIRVG